MKYITRKKAVFVLMTAVILIEAVLFCGCESNEGDTQKEEPKIQVETEQPVVGTLSVNSNFVGTVEASEKVSIIPRISGEVVTKNFQMGDHVNAGDLLFSLDDSEYQIAKTNAEASVKTAQANVQSAQATLTSQQAANDAAKAAATEAQGTVDSTRTQLNNGVNSANADLNTAVVDQANAANQANTYASVANQTKQEITDAESQLQQAEGFTQHLNDLQNNYNEIANGGTDASLKAQSYDVTISEIGSETDAKKIADLYLKLHTSYDNFDKLVSASAAAAEAEQTIRTEGKNLQDSYITTTISQLEAAANAKKGNNSIATAQDAKNLAERLKNDFENYTIKTTNANANSSIVGGDAAVKEAGAQVTGAQANLTSANAGLKLADLQLDYTKVTSPITGVIEQINVQQYGMASDQSVAYVINSEDGKKVSFYVTENVMRNLILGQDVSVEKDGNIYKAQISNVCATIDPEKSLFKVEAVLNGEDAGVFSIGTSVKLNTATEQAQNTIMIPISAVYYDNEIPYVFVAKDGKAVRTEITTGITNDTSIQVLTGLTQTDQVITSWTSQLKDNAQIELSDTNSTEDNLAK